MRSQGVSVDTLPQGEYPPDLSHEWFYMLGGEEKEIEAMISELMAAFPTQTSEGQYII